MFVFYPGLPHRKKIMLWMNKMCAMCTCCCEEAGSAEKGTPTSGDIIYMCVCVCVCVCVCTRTCITACRQFTGFRSANQVTYIHVRAHATVQAYLVNTVGVRGSGHGGSEVSVACSLAVQVPADPHAEYTHASCQGYALQL